MRLSLCTMGRTGIAEATGPRVYVGWIWRRSRWLSTALLFAALTLPLSPVAHGFDQACDRYQYDEDIEVTPLSGILRELHVRHNFQGDVVIRDGKLEGTKILIQIEKTGSTEAEINGITTNQTMFDVRKPGTIFVLQLDHLKARTRTVTVVIGAAIAGALFLTLTSLSIWWYYRRHAAPFSPVLGPDVSESRETGLDDDYPDGSSTNTPVHRQNGGSQSVCPPPPPPRRGDPTYMSTAEVRASGRSGLGSPRGMSKGTVATLSVMTVLSVVYAACPYDARAKLIINIPLNFKMDAVKLFFNRAVQNEVYTDEWHHQNGTQIQVFDLESAAPSANPPCEGHCANAYVQNLAGCDAMMGECVCQRGYDLVKNVCVDIDECTGPAGHNCPLTASCQNTVGSYVCQCGYGFYGDRKTCKACSIGCPPGLYESSPCTNFGDRVCKECSKCKGSQYEARPCGGTTDRQCMHVAHPLLIAGEETTPVFLEELRERKPQLKRRKRLKVEATSNVFLEDLHSTRNLETTYYVTDTTQAYDFYWDRESNLRVNIGVLNVKLIPEYNDVDHESDNKYMLGNPNNSEDKTKFRNIVRNHCRHPIPDYYSITLEISRDRTTAAEPVHCDSNDPQTPSCPAEYNDGDTYIHRTLNDACEKMGTFPEPLEPAANSIVCTANTALLREIFNQTHTPERAIPFPPRRCRAARSRCEQCLSQTRCPSMDLFEKRCCQIDCYTLTHCKTFQSGECTSAPVECAMGDAYRYTIQPVFENIKKEFMCHIRRKEPEVLYQLFFYVQIPGTNFQTPKVYKTIYARDLEYQSHGEYKADYVTVEHNTGLRLQDEFIMIGKEQEGMERLNYSINSMKEADDYRKKRVVVHEISHNIFVASTQFAHPFDYSTSSWVRNNECNKNVSKFRNVQKHYNDDRQEVTAVTQSVGSPFNYYLKSAENPPYIRFTVPGNMSILPYYFHNNGPTLMTNSTLKAALELTSGGRIWNLRLSGKMTGCPGYLGVTVNNRLDLEELFHYDLLILCPQEFNLTFKVPNWGQEPDKTFDIHLEDAESSYDIYLTQLIFEQHRVKAQRKPLRMPKPAETSGLLFAIVGALTLVFLLMLFIGYIYTENTKAQLIYDNRQKTRRVYVDPAAHAQDQADTTGCSGGKSPHLDQKQSFFIGCYIFLRIVYSLLFTFTVFFAILMLFIEGQLSTMSLLSEYQSEKHNATVEMSHTIDEYGRTELLRQGELVTSMQGACSNYIGELFDSMATEMDNITANQHLLDMYGAESSISFLLHSRTQERLAHYWDHITHFTDGYRSHLESSTQSALASYQHYLATIFHDDWYQFPQQLFNQSSMAHDHQKMLRSKSQFTGPEVDFGIFLEIEEVEDVHLWNIQYWERYYNQMADFPSLPVPSLDHHVPQCHLEGSTDGIQRSLTNGTPLAHLDSTKYTSTPVVEQTLVSPKHRTTHIAEEYQYIAPPLSHDPQAAEAVLFSVDDFVSSLNINILRIVLLVLDAVLLLYRFSHTYMNANMLCRGFEDNMGREPSSKNHCNNGYHQGQGEMQQLAQANSGGQGGHQADRPVDRSLPPPPTPDDALYAEGNIPDYTAPLNGNHGGAGNYMPNTDMGAAYQAKGQHANDPSWKDHKFDVIKYVIARLILNNTLPKLLIAAALLLLFYLLVKFVMVFLDVSVISQTDGFNVFLGALDIQLNQTNWYVMDQAEHFNDVTMKIYQGQMRSELLNLQSMLEYFNSEQSRLVENYITEACAVKREYHSNWTCDVHITPPRLHIPMLPCNFIPIQPQLHTGFNTEQYEQQIAESFDTYISAARYVILNTSYAIIITIATMLIIHIGGAVLFHYLKTRSKFPVRKIYISSSPPARGERQHRHPTQGAEESDYDSDEGDSNYPGNYPTSTRVRMSPQKSNTLLTDFKYSETKV